MERPAARVPSSRPPRTPRRPQPCADLIGSAPTASFTVTKLAWLAAHEPANAARTKSVLLPHDWLSWKLAGSRPGQATTDHGDASGTGRDRLHRTDPGRRLAAPQLQSARQGLRPPTTSGVNGRPT
ncbi:MAG TPA: FGGY family carbohydrate kinase [Pedococcus sp.]|nr:FGGY family carbohydrate kinase [Pedococcus sp.]